MWNALAERDYGYAQLPRYALGVSSGGAMAMVLAKYFPLQVRTPFLSCDRRSGLQNLYTTGIGIVCAVICT